MKLQFLTICWLCSLPVFANKIDSLKTDNDLIEFISEIYQKAPNTLSSEFFILYPLSKRWYYNCDSITSGWHLNPWQKADFNEDGRSDLITSLWYRYRFGSDTLSITLIVIDKGNNNFAIMDLPHYIVSYCYEAIPVTINQQQCLLYRYFKNHYVLDNPGDTSFLNQSRHIEFIGKTDTLVYKYGAFVEYSALETTRFIKSIKFKTTFCQILCPVYELTIFRSGIAKYDAIDNNKESGHFDSRLRQEEVNEIFSLAEYIHTENLNDAYDAESLHLQLVYLEIIYSDGSIKSIEDIGRQGTFGLMRLYELLDTIHDTHQWK